MEKLKDILDKQREYYYKGSTLSYEFRVEALIKLKNAIKKYETEIMKALKEDLGKSDFEAYTNEIGVVYLEINHTIKNLKSWMKDKKVFLEIFLQPGKGRIYHEPYGNTLIIAPWNYPFQLLISPLVAAIAAGNTSILKPSEVSSATEKISEKLISEIYSEEFVKIVKGGVEETTELLKLPFDKIFFTGSVPVGRIVMEAASKNLVPITLELGGKSPAIVHKDANIKLAASKIAWGKFNNAGQTCVAPDYVLVHKSIEHEFLNELRNTIKEFYGDNIKKNKNYGRIINERHVNRIKNLINYDKIFFGGEVDVEEKYIEPTIMNGVTLKDSIMEDEIFGPILPVLVYNQISEAIDIVRHFSKPLALYLFTRDKAVEDLILRNVSFGGGGVNTTILHVASTELPFGGVGPSGMGSYHGKAGFLEFSHKKSIIKQPSNRDFGVTYPHKALSLGIIKKIMK